MSSPFQVFRKNQQRLLVVFGVLLMVSFIIVPILTDALQPNGGSNNNAVVVKWNGGLIRESELRGLLRRNNVTVNFLEAVLARAADKDDDIDGSQHILQRVRGSGEVINNLLLAEKAESLNLVITDDAVIQYLNDLTDKALSTDEYYTIQRRVAGDQQISMPEIFDEIRTALAARYMQSVLYAGVGSLPPQYHWESFRRLNEHMELEILPISVADLAETITDDPDENELRNLYEDRKDKFPYPNSPEFGFRQLPKIDFHYVKFDFEKYLQKAEAELTEEEIAAEYQKSIESGQYRKPVTLPPMEPGDDGDTDTDDTENETGDKTDETGDTENETGDKTDESASPTTEESGTEPEGVKPEPEKQSRVTTARKTEFVSTQTQDDPVAGSDPVSGNEPETTQPETTQPETTEPETTEPEGEGDTDATDPKKPSTETPDIADAFLPLEDVRDQIIERLARPKAQTMQDDAMEAVRVAMSKHASDYNIAKFNDKGDLPKTPSALKLGLDNGATGRETGKLDYIQIKEKKEEELGQSQRFQGFQNESFEQFAYNPNVQLFATRESTSVDSTDIRFIFWKAVTEDEKIPAYEGVKGLVEEAWKKTKARELAEKRAEEWVDEAKSAKGLNLEELLPKQAEQVKRTGEFSWLTQGSFSMFGGGPELSTIDGIDGITPESMEQVFKLAEDEIAVLSNASKSEYYVVRVDYRGPSENTMRIRFSMERATVYPPTAQADFQIYNQDLMKSLDQEFNVSR